MKNLILFALISIASILQGQSELIDNQETLDQLRSKFKFTNYYKPTNETKSIFDRYVNGETKLIDSIALIFKSNDIKFKKSLFQSMLERPFDFQFPKDVQKIILSNFSLDDIDFVWIIGRYKFDGYVQFFESKLLTGNIEQQANLLYWLGNDGTSTIGFHHLKKMLTTKSINIYENSRLLDALYNYMYSSTPNIKSEAIDLAIEIYNSKRIYNQIHEYGEYYAKDFEDRHVYELLSLGGKKILPLAKLMYSQKEHEEIALSTMLANDCSRYEEELIRRINSDIQYDYIGRNASIAYLKSCSDVTIIPLLIKKYYKNDIKGAIDFFMGNNLLKEFAAALDMLEDPSLAKKLKEQIMIKTKTANEIIKDLFDMGIISKIDTSVTVQKVNAFQNQNKSLYRGQVSMISPYFYFLFNSPINTRFDLESNEFPIQYDEIFFCALKLSTKELGEPKIYSITNLADDMSSANHNIFIDFGNFGVKTSHTSTSLYPDLNFVTSTLNLCNSINKSQNKFYSDIISESNVIFYTDHETYSEYSKYLKNGCD